MIPRLKPALNHRELLATLSSQSDSVVRFEAEFARVMGAKFAVAYPYGRSAEWAFFKTLGIEGAEVILPAYTCSVVAHAVVLSDNIPHFIDASLIDYNMTIDGIAGAINKNTRVIIATHLFGYPMNINTLQTLVAEAQARYGHKIWVIQDCAHSFGAEWQNQPIQLAPDVALFGLNISKTMTSIFGGMLITDNADLANRLRTWRDNHFSTPSWKKGLYRRLYLGALYPAFNNWIYGLVEWLQEETSILKNLTDAYHLDEKIHFPPDYLDMMLPVEAQVGLVQLGKYQSIIAHRRELAQFYNDELHKLNYNDWILPPLVSGATYSHYVIRVPDRQPWLDKARNSGIQLGQLIEYSIPELTPYQQYAKGDFPNARYAKEHMINVPIHTGVEQKERQQIVGMFQSILRGF